MLRILVFRHKIFPKFELYRLISHTGNLTLRFRYAVIVLIDGYGNSRLSRSALSTAQVRAQVVANLFVVRMGVRYAGRGDC
jgi:hypothetical protein